MKSKTSQNNRAKKRKSQFSYGILVALVSFLLSLVNDFGNNFLSLNGRESDLILFTIIVITVDQLNQRGSIEQIREDLIQVEEDLISEVRSIDTKTLELMRDSNDSVGIITEIGTERVFDGFIGEEYHAYNAPLQYENENLKDRLGFHIERYKDSKFKMSHYYYPIFSLPDRDSAKEWMEGVYNFYQYLNNSNYLEKDEKKKITFHVPSDQYTFSPDSRITYFIGRKYRGYEAIVYIHNSAFMSPQSKSPRAMFRIYNDKMIDWLRRHRKETAQKNMDKIVGIENFLKYLEKKLEI